VATGYVNSSGVDFEDLFELHTDVTGNYNSVSTPEFLLANGAQLGSLFVSTHVGNYGSSVGFLRITPAQAAHMECEPGMDGENMCFTVPARSAGEYDIGHKFKAKGSVQDAENRPTVTGSTYKENSRTTRARSGENICYYSSNTWDLDDVYTVYGNATVSHWVKVSGHGSINNRYYTLAAQTCQTVSGSNSSTVKAVVYAVATNGERSENTTLTFKVTQVSLESNGGGDGTQPK
jgi:hypothetical protein